MICSMTAFASAQGGHDTFEWTWEMRSVNARGLDLRLRIPDWLDGLEVAVRGELTKALSRGNVTLSLRVAQVDDIARIQVNREVLNDVLAALVEVEEAAQSRGADLAPSRSSDILNVRGVLETASATQDVAPIVAHLMDAAKALIEDFVLMRAREGASLEALLTGQLNTIDALVSQAQDAVAARGSAVEATLREQIAKFSDVAIVEPERIAQELAVLAVKADVTEELDRLKAHVVAAGELIAKGGVMGRKLDFLCQEFNREANTLCSKSQFSELTSVGLDLKATIDQMREQVQNVE